VPIIDSTELHEYQLDVTLGQEDLRAHRILLGGSGVDLQIPTDFDNEARISSLDTHFAMYGVGNFNANPPPKIQRVIEEIHRIVQEEGEKHAKILIYTKWAKMVPIILAHLFRSGIRASAVTDSTSATERNIRFRKFNLEKGHPSESIVAPKSGFELHQNATTDTKVYFSEPCRIMLMTDVASAGVNLQRANHLFLLDSPWTDGLRRQLIGHVWRIG
jgi:hypothetical protein